MEGACFLFLQILLTHGKVYKLYLIAQWITFYFILFFSFIFIRWRLITLQYCSGFCHTLTWISHTFTCIPHPDPPSHLPLHPIPLGLPSAQARALVSCIQPGLVICFTLDNIHAVLSKHPTLDFSQSPKVCSVHLCLFFCFAYRVIITIFLNSIYMY